MVLRVSLSSDDDMLAHLQLSKLGVPVQDCRYSYVLAFAHEAELGSSEIQSKETYKFEFNHGKERVLTSSGRSYSWRWLSALKQLVLSPEPHPYPRIL